MGYLVTEDTGELPTWDYTLTRSDNGLPIVGADIWITTDISGGNMIAHETTDAFGVASFLLDSGDYYIWRRAAGFSFSDPQAVTV